MTALPLQYAQLLSAHEFAALPEATDAHYELQEGIVVMSPRPAMRHQKCLQRLCPALEAACPDDLAVYLEVDVDLELVPPGRPGFVRAPDVVVVRPEAVQRVEAEGGILRAAELLLAVEVLSPTTRRTDTVVKHGEYADAGVPHYWVVDPAADEVTVTVSHLAGEFGYVDERPVRGVFAAEQPFAVRIDLTRLR